MAAIEIFSCSVSYKYKSKICSLSFLVVLFFIVLSLFTPFFIIYNAGGMQIFGAPFFVSDLVDWFSVTAIPVMLEFLGFSLKNRAYVEAPDVSFNYKYLLLAYRDYNINPIICSTFATYKNNRITDDCILIKVQELDTNRDGKKDGLNFEARFHTDRPIKSFKLLLFFNFRLKQLFEVTIESIAVFNHILNEEIQKIHFSGDLILQQKGLLNSEGLYETYNHSVELADSSLEELITQNDNRKFSAKIVNERIMKQVACSTENAVVFHGELMYREYLIYYQPSIWEELKWAWVQYLSCVVVLGYVVKRILIFLFSNRYLNCYIMVPWKNK